VVVKPPKKYTDKCRELATAKVTADYNEKCRLQRLAAKEAPPKVDKVTSGILTDAEQERINRDILRKSDSMRAKVNQDMLAQRLLVGAIVPAYGTGYGKGEKTEYAPPKKVLPFISNHACTWD